jgi:hypothetical protein
MGAARSVFYVLGRRSSASLARARFVILFGVAPFGAACTLDFDRFRPPFAGEIVDAATPADDAHASDASNGVDAMVPDAREDAPGDAASRRADADR